MTAFNPERLIIGRQKRGMTQAKLADNPWDLVMVDGDELAAGCAEGLFEKLSEETGELRQQLEKAPTPGPRPHARGVAGASGRQLPDDLRANLEEEVGDLFFVLVNIARYLSLDPESALKKTNRKFKRRFQWMEEQLRAAGREPQQASMDELESLWQQAKQQEQAVR